MSEIRTPGEIMRQVRRRLGLSQSRFAELLARRASIKDYGQNGISLMELGNRDIPPEVLAAVLSLDTDEAPERLTGAELRGIRLGLNMSQARLAERLNELLGRRCTGSVISRWETSCNPVPSKVAAAVCQLKPDPPRATVPRKKSVASRRQGVERPAPASPVVPARKAPAAVPAVPPPPPPAAVSRPAAPLPLRLPEYLLGEARPFTPEQFGALLRRVREWWQLPLTDLAGAIGWTEGDWSALERGERRLLGRAAVYHVAPLLGVEPWQLLRRLPERTRGTEVRAPGRLDLLSIREFVDARLAVAMAELSRDPRLEELEAALGRARAAVRLS